MYDTIPTGSAHRPRGSRVYIANQESLEAFVARARSSSVLAIDTEFLREKTYRAKLCLLQMATDTEVAIVDPFAVDDLHVIVELLVDDAIVKLFHAGSQDLEIIYHDLGVVPHPLFDTQVAAALLGQTQQVGYGALVHALCGVSLKKTDSFTDWSQRPLSDSQLEYAADDVIYLPQLYAIMTEKLSALGRLGWLDPDFEDMQDPSHYVQDPDQRFHRLRRVNQLSGRHLAQAKAVAAWRERQAAKRDIPRKWVLSDEQVVEICKRDVKSIDDLFMVRGVRNHLSTRDARALLGCIKEAQALPPEQWPKLTRPGRSERNVDAEVDLMNALVRLRAKENGIAMQTLASHDELCKVARGHTEGAAVLKGWRREIVGEELLELLEGKLSLRLDGPDLVVQPA